MTTSTRRPSPLRDTAMMLAGDLMLSGVAFYNRYPLMYPDTGGYLLGRTGAFEVSSTAFSSRLRI